MHYYQFNIADFALHTSHLSLEEEAVYRRLLDFYYDTEKPIPKETQSVIRRLRLGSSSDILALILDEFFTLEDDGWHNYRCDIEIKSYHSKAESARKNGKKGGRPPKNKGVKTQSVNLANPDTTQAKANQELLTINHKPLTNIKDDGDFKEVLDYLHSVTGRKFQKSTDLAARLKANSVDEIKQVIDYKAKEWMGSDMQKYLRPQTLFNATKFEGYLNDSNQLVPTEKMNENRPQQNAKPAIDWKSTDWCNDLR